MIQLYHPKNTNYNNNGDVVLLPQKAEIKATINGVWELELIHDLDDLERWKAIQENAVIKVPSFLEENQLFRVISIDKSVDSIEVICEPIFMDCKNEIFLEDVRPTDKNGQQALNYIFSNTQKYRGQSNIGNTSTAYYEYMNALEALVGADNSFLNRWGGEILYNNFTIVINEKIGEDNGTELIYGKNIAENGLTETVDMSTVCTRLFPKAYNGVKYLKNSKSYIDSELLNTYPIIYTNTIKFEHIKLEKDVTDEDRNNPNIIICKNQEELNVAIEKEVKTYFSSGIDKPKVTINANMTLLSGTTLYNDFKVLERVSLGDTIHCKHSKLNIYKDLRIIDLTYDCLLNKVNSVKLGDFEYNFFNSTNNNFNNIQNSLNGTNSNIESNITNVSAVEKKLNNLTSRVNSVIRSNDTVIAEKVNGNLSSISITEQNKIEPIIVFSKNNGIDNLNAFGIGCDGISISQSNNGGVWSWQNIINVSGIKDKNNNFWDFQNGKINIKNGAINITAQNPNEKIIEIINGNKKIALSLEKLEIIGEQGSTEIIGGQIICKDKNGETIFNSKELKK